jgi:GT2 family glycosyltransferase
VAPVICSWNGREDTLACLESLAQMRWEGLTPIVVDNGSTDGTAEAVRERFPDVVLLRSESNIGASGGNNLGMRHALELGADYVFVLNNDTSLDPDLIAELVAEAERRPDAGALCPLIYYEDPPDLVWYAGAEYEPDRGYNGQMTGYRERDTGQFEGVREIGALVTCAVLVPRPILEDVGLLDDSLFIQIDDFEWSLRMRRAGYRIYCVSGARMWHKISAACGGEDSPTVAYYAVRNTLAVNARHAPLRGPSALRRYATTLGAHLAHARKGEHPLRNLLAVVEGWRDFHRGRLGARGSAARP